LKLSIVLKVMIKKKNSILILPKMIAIRPKRKRKKKYLIYSFRKIIVPDLGLVLILTQMKTDLDHRRSITKSTNTEAEAGKINNHLGPTITNEDKIKITIKTEIEGAIKGIVGIENTRIEEIAEIEEIIEIIKITEAIMEVTDTEEEIVISTKTKTNNRKNNKFQNKFQCQLKFQCQMKES
jgi:hypothetical protein